MRAFFTLALSAALFVSSVLSAPAAPSKRQDTNTYCGQWDTVDLEDYILYINQWGKQNAQSGQSCASINSVNGNEVAWTTTWTWTGGEGVKSYTNINAKKGIDTQLSSLSSIKAKWSWIQTTGSNTVTNIAYDLFTSSAAGGSDEYEIMIWLDNVNAGPISYTYNAEGKPTPIATGLSFAGKTWNLFYGSNGVNYVYSFLTADGSSIPNFSGDLKEFFDYLTSKQQLKSSQYLVTAQGGTEATQGSATLKSSAFSIVIN